MPLVFDNMELPGLDPAPLRRVDVYLVANSDDTAAGGPIDASDITVLDRQTELSNAAGYVDFNLRPNSTIDPPTSYYIWDVHLSDGRVFRRTLTVPDVAGPIFVNDIVDDPPARVNRTGDFDIRLFGAIGDGTTDDYASIQAAIDASFAAGGGFVYIPWLAGMVDPDVFWRITQPLIMRPGVSLVGDPRRPKIKNTTGAGGAGVQECLLPGNLHPDFTEDLTYYACGTIAAGYTVTLTAAGDAAHFSVDQQVFVASNTGFSSAGFTVPDYAFVNRVVDKAGATLTLEYPIDVSFAGKITPFGSAVGRNSIPLFAWQDATCTDLSFEATNWYVWGVDSGTLNVQFERVTTKGRGGITYGNAYQHTNWRDCRSFFTHGPTEMSLNSLHAIAENCEWFCLPGGTALSHMIHERSRFCSINGGSTVYSDDAGAEPMLRTQDAQNSGYDGHKVISRDAGYTAACVMHEGSAQAAFPAYENYARDCVFDITQAGQYVVVRGQSLATNYRNGAERCTFSGIVTDLALRFEDSLGNYVKNNYCPDGAVGFIGTCTGNHVDDNFTADGFSSEGGTSPSDYQSNYVFGHKSTKWLAKQVLRLNDIAQHNIGVGVTADVYDIDVGANLIVRDTVDIELNVQCVGSTNTRTVRVHIYDSTAAADTTLFTATIPAASTSRVAIKGSFELRGTIIDYDFVMLDNTSGLVTPYVGAVTQPTAGHSLKVRVEGGSGGGDTQLNFQAARIGIRNPYYAAA